MLSIKLFQIFSIITILLPYNLKTQHLYSDFDSESSEIALKNTSHRFTGNIGGDQIVFRVVNGQPAQLGEIPYQIAYMQQRSGTLYEAVCGGSIIGPKKILTAAHCIERVKISDCHRGQLKSSDFRPNRVVAGQLWSRARHGAQGQWRTIQSGKYPRFFKFPFDDIAILFLDKQFNYNNNIQPIPYATKLIDYNLECTISGYGRLSAKLVSDRLMRAEIKTLSMKVCNKIHHTDFSKFVCTSDIKADTHRGDSGGPLTCRGTGDPAEGNSSLGIVVGVVAGKIKARLMSSFFTRVTAYYDFVNCSSKLQISSCYTLLFFLFNQYIVFFSHSLK